MEKGALLMIRILLRGPAVLGCALLCYTATVMGQTSGVMPVAAQQALVNQYCVGCHNDKLKSGGFSWASVDLAHPDRNTELLETAIRKLRAGVMPPASMPRPDAAATKAFAASLEEGIDRTATNHP